VSLVSAMWDLISGEYAGKDCPETDFPLYIHNEDLAVAHVYAIEKLAAKGNRFMTVGPSLSMYHYAYADVQVV
jgi:UDP-glucose 4-epimerase